METFAAFVKSSSFLNNLINVLGWFAYIFLVFFFHSIFHETAHAVFRKRFGMSPQVSEFSVLPLKLFGDYFLIPFPVGFNAIVSDIGGAPSRHNPGKFRMFLIYASGPIATFVISAIALLIAKGLPETSFEKFVLVTVAATGALMLPENLFAPGSDGVQALRTLVARNAQTRKIVHPSKKMIFCFLWTLALLFCIATGISLAAAVIWLCYA
ncbi:MAG: hypothetical protein K6T65_17000 [Peptococcaceae bacterium]|nr:hypothetical protein [Peptococcaceae bacterium]